MHKKTYGPIDRDGCRFPARGRWVSPVPLRSLLAILLVALLLAGCAGGGSRPSGGSPQAFDPDNIPDAVPRVEPRSRYGNPDSYVVFGKRYHTKDGSRGFVERGLASWYGKKFHGRKTSSGEPYNMYSMTAAHKTLPLPTYVRVTNLDNGRSTVVRVNDRGPFHQGRVIDLSYAAATKLGVVKQGTARVEVRAIDPRGRESDREVFLAESGAASDRGSRGRSTNQGRTRSGQSTRSAHTSGSPALAERTTRARNERVMGAALAATGVHAVARPAQGSSRSAANARRGLYLQVGAFGDPGNAERLRQRLVSHLAGKVRVQSSSGGGSMLYKVRVGPFGSEREAGVVSAKLVDLGVDRPNPVWN